MSRPGIFWLTINPSDIAIAKQFMDSLKGDNTVDVLGLTRTMEGVSDILFPATSTSCVNLDVSTTYNSMAR